MIPTPQRADAEQRGRRAETIAAWWLRCQGWRIIGVRVRTPVGEVDLVARRFATVAFVEVKARADDRGFMVAVDRSRLRRVAAAADFLAHQPRFRAVTMRIDVILVAPRRLPRHLVDVWNG